ncbi:50S ribosomal protein L1 [Sphingobacteriales bacterium UPWRP_1]|nr:50S ribosomal protein L1 [Sphingobacteriales bacterium TSM_CSM]PSJ77050.1 50S ribosomal protein L1 [Sphingobacteriales bacterium UPWRP_1]
MKLTKKRKAVNGRVDSSKLYALTEAAALVKEVNTTKFDSSVDLHVKLGVDPRKPDQAIRGSVSLPHGTGRVKRILVLCSPDKEEEAKQAGADYYGLNEYVDKILAGWTDIDVIIATPNVMAQVGKLGRILGPRGLMPNPKTGTITPNVAAAVEEVKKGKIDFKVDKYGIIHASVGRVSFSPEKIAENAIELMHTLARMKPTASKGVYIKSIYMASTMSPGIAIEPKTIKGI